MKPIVLIHGYSAESKETDKSAITSIYGDMPKALRKKYGRANIVEIDLSRYISLDDGLTLDDVARGFNRALQQDRFAHLNDSGFHTLVHSTGALVIRNWLRDFSPRPSPLHNLIYLAGANFGSGWAHIGKGQFAKWGRMVFDGTERGVKILNALEFGSDWTIELHRHFLQGKNSLPEKYGVFEHVVVGTQADASWFTSPIRYAREDGSDGVVRVSASNLNFYYVRMEATDEARALSWRRAETQSKRDRTQARGGRDQWYDVATTSRPGVRGRPVIPFAIPFQCAHSGGEMGIVIGEEPRQQVLRLIDLALKTTPGNWPGRVAKFHDETAETYRRAVGELAPGRFRRLLMEPRSQYDHHAQVVFRLRDQDGRPVEDYDIYFNSVSGPNDKSLPINSLIEDKHKNSASPNIMTFYLRTDTFDAELEDWQPQVPDVNGCYLEIAATETDSDEILYLPFRYQFSQQQLIEFLKPDRTTIVDIELLRLPSPDVFKLVTY